MSNVARKITVTEGEDFRLEVESAVSLRAVIDGLEDTLRPRIRFLSERRSSFRLNNVVGTIKLDNGTALEVRPKVADNDDWTASVISLLTGDERISVAGERRAGISPVHRNLLDALADVYLARLERAFRQDGPLMLMERESLTLPHLRGTLNASEWLRKAAWAPHRFPVSITRLASDNPFTRGMCEVARILASASSSTRTRSRLNAIRRDLSPNDLPFERVNAGTNRKLPEQWSAYKPAWSIAVAVLNRGSLFGTTGNHAGLSLAVEPWPLLETALERALSAVEAQGPQLARRLEARMKGRLDLLIPVESPFQKGFAVEPDGRLYEDGAIVATFEAKYKKFEGLPARSDIYQAVTTASVCNSSLAILVYPTALTPVLWDVTSFHGRPAKLAAIGMDMFRWTGTASANDRANFLLNFIDAIRRGEFIRAGKV
jgi:hypothetical protein